MKPAKKKQIRDKRRKAQYDRLRYMKPGHREKKLANAKVQRDKNHKKRLELIELFGNRCKDCHYTFPSPVYEFHHREPATKRFAISSASLIKSFEVLLDEAQKCDLLCRNCHALRHIKMRQDGSRI